jgi:hypothetical protein
VEIAEGKNRLVVIEPFHHEETGSQMSPLKRRIVTVTDTTANLVAQLRELEQLREQLKRALSAKRAPQLKRRNANRTYSTSAYVLRADRT